MVPFSLKGPCTLGTTNASSTLPRNGDSGMWGAVPVSGHDSVQLKKCPASHRNHCHTSSGILPRLPWIQCPTSTGIRTSRELHTSTLPRHLSAVNQFGRSWACDSAENRRIFLVSKEENRAPQVRKVACQLDACVLFEFCGYRSKIPIASVKIRNPGVAGIN
jgi:hypothetical protein